MRECRCQHAVAANNRRIYVMGGRNLQGREVAYLSSCEYLPFDDSGQIDGLLLRYFMRQPNLGHIYPISPSIDLLSVGLNCPTGTERDIKAQQMLILNNIPNRQWTYINHNNPFEDKFKAWSMTAKNGHLYLSGLSHFSCSVSK